MSELSDNRLVEKSQWNNPRKLVERIRVQGELVLETPTHLGNGDSEGPLDLPLIRDELLGVSLLTGTTLAGGLRAYLSDLEENDNMAERLFGLADQNESRESYLIVDDAFGFPPGVPVSSLDNLSESSARSYQPVVELRDGVSICTKTRTTMDEKKFDIELLAAGTHYPLSFELLLTEGEADLLEAFVKALKGLESGALNLGKRKRRGFGRCCVTKWQVCRYPMNPAGLARWLEDDLSEAKSGEAIDLLLLGKKLPSPSRARECKLVGCFQLDGSLLIRSATSKPPARKDKSKPRLPDQVHLRSLRGSEFIPVLSGTSLAGALRSQTIRIANTLGKNGYKVADDLFGLLPDPDRKDEPLTASRIWVEESVIQKPLDLAQSRVKIDRFTGGAYPGALFTEQPVFGQSGTELEVNIRIREARDDDIGLLLLLLKDLWTGCLTLGGERSVGRGRLQGKWAELSYGGKTWRIESLADNGLLITGDGTSEELQEYVDAFTGSESNETAH